MKLRRFPDDGHQKTSEDIYPARVRHWWCQHTGTIKALKPREDCLAERQSTEEHSATSGKCVLTKRTFLAFQADKKGDTWAQVMTIISQITIPQRAYCVSFCRNVRALLVSSKKYLKHEEQSEKKKKQFKEKFLVPKHMKWHWKNSRGFV